MFWDLEASVDELLEEAESCADNSCASGGGVARSFFGEDGRSTGATGPRLRLLLDTDCGEETLLDCLEESDGVDSPEFGEPPLEKLFVPTLHILDLRITERLGR